MRVLVIINHWSISKYYAKLNQAESPYIEPGLLAIFRLAVVLQIVTLLVSSAINMVAERANGWRTVTFISLAGLIFLLGYLTWPLLWHALGRLYLPIALIIAAGLPLLERALFIYFQLKQTSVQWTEQEMFGLSWRIYIVLLIPLVLLAWQYTFRWVLLFSSVLILISQVFVFWGRQVSQQSELTELSLHGAVSFLIVGYIMTRILYVQREQRQAFIKANTQLADYSRTMEQLAISRERNRLARDLHDTLAHTLSAVSIQLEAIDSAWDDNPDQARALLIKALGAARSGLAETRRALQALRAAPLDDLGLALAVRTLAELMAARAGIKLVVDITSEITLATEVEQIVYRIAQEALTNIVQHAKAQLIKLTLTQHNTMFLLMIEDDGVGFRADKPVQTEHYGLLGMQERAALMGAQLQIESQLQHGTVIRLTLAKYKGNDTGKKA